MWLLLCWVEVVRRCGCGTGLIIGRGGENVRSLSKETGVFVKLADGSSIPPQIHERPVTLDGEPGAVEKAAHILADRILSDPECRGYHHLTTTYARYLDPMPEPHGMSKRLRTAPYEAHKTRGFDDMYGRYDDPYARPNPHPHYDDEYGRFGHGRRPPPPSYRDSHRPPGGYRSSSPYAPRQSTYEYPPPTSRPPPSHSAQDDSNVEKMEVEDEDAGTLVSGVTCASCSLDTSFWLFLLLSGVFLLPLLQGPLYAAAACDLCLCFPSVLVHEQCSLSFL